jgi:Mannose-6-phosphate isomerase
MNILFISNSKNEPFFDVDPLVSGVNALGEGFYAEKLDMTEIDLRDLSMNDVEKIISGTKINFKDFDAVHTFSVFPFINRVFFTPFVFYTMDFEFLKKDFGAFLENIDNLNCCECDIKGFSAKKLCDFYEKTILNSKAFDTRPWGWWKTMINAVDYKIKHIFINPNQKLSLQTHDFRSETWVIAEGSGFIVIGNRRFRAEKGLVFTIPKKEKHRAETEDSSMTIIELQLGSYLGEDDIKRIEDIYGRI